MKSFTYTYITESIRIPRITIAITAYCFFVNFSFKNILDNITDTTHTDDIIGTAVSKTATNNLSFWFKKSY